MFTQQCNRRANLSRGAIAALKSVMLNEGRLRRMDLAILRQALDRSDLITFVHDSQRQAAVNPSSIGEYRTRAALTVIAAFLAPSESKILSKKVEQGHARINLNTVRLTINFQGQGKCTAGGFVRIFNKCCSSAAQWFGQISPSSKHAYSCHEPPPGQVGI